MTIHSISDIKMWANNCMFTFRILKLISSPAFMMIERLQPFSKPLVVVSNKSARIQDVRHLWYVLNWYCSIKVKAESSKMWEAGPLPGVHHFEHHWKRSIDMHHGFLEILQLFCRYTFFSWFSVTECYKLWGELRVSQRMHNYCWQQSTHIWTALVILSFVEKIAAVLEIFHLGWEELLGKLRNFWFRYFWRFIFQG